MSRSSCWLLLPLALCFCASRALVAAEFDFDREIAPLLAKRCLSCHTGEAPKGKLDLSQRETAFRGGDSGPAIVPRSLNDSPLWQRIAADEMPPKHPLPATEKKILSEWIISGAVWSDGSIDPLQYSSDERAGYDWWSLQPLQRPGVGAAIAAVPAVVSPIDVFIQDRLAATRSGALAGSEAPALSAPLRVAANQVEPSVEAPRTILIRRLSFDLLGLPPSPEEVAEFVNDSRPDAWERLVDRFLASPHYGERWARHWLDVVRYGESNGFERDLPRPNAWPYRDWVIQALNADMPYDEFARWQVAGDVLAEKEPTDGNPWASAAALGFLVAGPHDTVVPVVDRMRQQMRQDELEDVVGVVGQTFLGLTVNCARCHDHKFDPISTREYYQLAAALSGADHGEREVVNPGIQRELDRLREQIAQIEQQLEREAEPIRKAILQEQSANAIALPSPLAAWDFTRDLKDRIGELHGIASGVTEITPQGLTLDGKSFVTTPPLANDLTEKTLEVRVKLSDLDQRGGGAFGIESLEGRVFDAIVFGEQEPRRWMAGSNNFLRTKSFGGSEESAAAEFVTVTVVYHRDGTIAGFRNGIAYGHSYQSGEPVTFEAGKAHMVFGLRHSPVGGNKLLKGVIAAARIFPRALTDEEVAASASSAGVAISTADILARLEPAQRTERVRRMAELKELQHRQAELDKTARRKMYTAVLTQPGAGRVLKRGNVAEPGDVVTPAGLAALRGVPVSFGLKPDSLEYQRRAGLAEWITDRRNPLFARVIVNRLWHYHFGSGLVETPNDLGFNGGRPSHPELLDWLACELVDNGYSLKHIHRLLVTSATYRQSSVFRSDAAAIDAQNRLLWRMSPRRLDAECVRDAMLVAAGELNDSIGGKGYSDFNSYFFKGTQFYDPIDPVGPESQRRTVYRMWARGGRSPFLDTFDCPDPSTTTPKRSTTTTPLQALSLMNNAFVLRMSAQLAERVQRECGPDVTSQARRLYWLLYDRSADDAEVQMVSDFIARRGLMEACRGLLNGAEFLYVD